MPRDLSSVGGPAQGEIFEGVVQELDIPTGRVLFEWHSAEHVELAESTMKAPPVSQGEQAAPFDYFHLNSIAEDANGDFLLSARHTSAIYKVDRETGRVEWRLGGKRSDFAMGEGTRFELQHDARWQPDGTLTLFDNGEKGKGVHSRVLVLRLDEDAKRATLVRTYVHPRKLFSETQANAQFLPNGHVFVGWGQSPFATEFDRDGRVLYDLRFGADGADSYRGYRAEWTGRPADDPALVAARGADGQVSAAVSWNGATEVARWQLLSGPDAQRLRVVAEQPRSGFETALAARTDDPVVRARALDSGGAVLGTSPPVRLTTGDD
jgi:hypothetical protein